MIEELKPIGAVVFFIIMVAVLDAVIGTKATMSFLVLVLVGTLITHSANMESILKTLK
jgi:hypothetical protein